MKHIEDCGPLRQIEQIVYAFTIPYFHFAFGIAKDPVRITLPTAKVRSNIARLVISRKTAYRFIRLLVQGFLKFGEFSHDMYPTSRSRIKKLGDEFRTAATPPARAATSVTGTPARTSRSARYRCPATDTSTNANPVHAVHV